MKIYYNPNTIDCYTIIDGEHPNRVAYGMSINPLSPQGFNQYLGDKIEAGPHLGEQVTDAKEIPPEVYQAIIDRLLDIPY